MLSLNKEFVDSNPNTGVILSPRNCKREQLERHASELKKKNASLLFDPQFYQPRTERENILNYPYWDNLSFSTVGFASNGAKKLCEGVIRYQVEVLGVSKVILPGRYTNALTEEWLESQYIFSQTADTMGVEQPIYITLALGPDIVSERQNFDRILNEVVEYPVDGVYVVLMPPKGEFLVTNESYIYNLLDAFLSLSLAGKKIILGYANQQCLIYAGAGVEGIATGNYRNVRSFNPDTFDIQEKDFKQRAVWYYDADTLSEFRPETLGLAYQRGLKGNFGPTNEYSIDLLNADNPASIPWGEKLAFRHYLTEINRQWLSFDELSRNQRINKSIKLLEEAQQKLLSLVDKGFRPGERSFMNAFDPTLNALFAFKSDRQSQISML
ncbi:hypothetical protein C0966_17880 (plasmid) [Bacillus methanolicus]|nr:hypothetical protein [Bacillus methanolicus]